MRVSFIIPTNSKRSYFEFLESTLEHLKPLQDFCKVNFSFCFQSWKGKGWDDWAIEHALRYLWTNKFNTTWCVEPQSDKPSMVGLRYKCMSLASDSDYFIIADDNFCFSAGTESYPYSSGERYVECLKYMELFQRCGFVMCEGSLGGSVQKREISSTKVGLFATTRGLILRNIGVGKIVRGTKHLLGGLEE